MLVDCNNFPHATLCMHYSIPSVNAYCPTYDFCIVHGSVATVLRWGRLNFSYILFLIDVACQKQLKSASVLQSYSITQMVHIFQRHDVVCIQSILALRHVRLLNIGGGSLSCLWGRGQKIIALALVLMSSRGLAIWSLLDLVTLASGHS